eukprot:5346940-Pyramimonas_sp.AAC.1
MHGPGRSPTDLYEQRRKLVSHHGHLHDNELGIDATSLACTAAWAGLLHLAGFQPSAAPARAMAEDRPSLPPSARRPTPSGH